MQVILPFIPSIRPWIPWCASGICGFLYLLVGLCLQSIVPYFMDWTGYIHPVTLLVMVMGSGIITIPLFYASYIPSILLYSMVGYALTFLQYITIHEQIIWSLPVVRFCGSLNLCMAAYMILFVILSGSNGPQRTFIFHIFKTSLPVVVLPQVLLIVLTDPVL
jgi:hypothetical protein